MAKPAVDLSEFEAHRKQVGPECSIGLIIEKLTEQQRVNLDAALADRSITTSQIRRVMVEWGHPVSHSTVQRHRRKECLCG